MTGQDLTVTLAAMTAFPQELETLFGCVPVARRNWRPQSWEGIPSEKLTAIEQVWHVRDIEIEGYHVRFARALAESDPVLPDLPGEQMAEERRYAEADPQVAFREFAAARATTVKMLRGLTALQLARPAVFEGRGTTLLGLVHYLASHDCQHLAGLQWLLARQAGR